jgi:hypothetical protein
MITTHLELLLFSGMQSAKSKPLIIMHFYLGFVLLAYRRLGRTRQPMKRSRQSFIARARQLFSAEEIMKCQKDFQ